MKIAFIQPHKQVLNLDIKDNNSEILADKSDGFTRAFISLPGMVVLGQLKKHEIYFIDATADNTKNIIPLNNYVGLIGISDEDLKSKIDSFNPDIALITSMFTTEYKSVNRLASVIKEVKDIPVVVGGNQATLRPNWHLESKDIDYIFLGEVNKNIGDLLKKIINGSIKEKIIFTGYRNKEMNYPYEIKKVLLDDNGNFRYTNDKIIRNPKLYLPQGTSLSDGAGIIYPSRGCPFDCGFCNATRKDGKIIRHLSLEDIIDMTKEQLEIGINTFYNASDTFGMHPIDREYLKWLGEVRKSRKDIHLINTNSFYARYFFPKGEFSKERVNLLKSAGFETVTIAIDSFNQRYNNRKLNGITSNMLNDLFKYIKDNGLKLEVYMIYGFPNQTTDELNKDIEEINYLSKNIDSVVWRHLTYFPGTRYYNYLINNGLIKEEEYKKLIDVGQSFYHYSKRMDFSNVNYDKIKMRLH